MKKLLVMGAGAFAGQDLVRAALETKEFEVFGQARTFKPSCFCSFDPKAITTIYCDLNKQFDGFCNALDRIQPDYIVNFVAQSEVPQSWDNPDHWYETNVVLISKLAKFLSSKSWLKKYLHVSSPEAYGNQENAVYENHQDNPSTPYAASKSAGDVCLKLFSKQYGLPVLFIRAANYSGARQQQFKIIPKSTLSMLKGIKIPLHGGGTSSRAFTDIKDVSRGELLLLEQGNIGETYHLANHEMPTVLEIVTMAYQELKSRDKLNGFFEEYVEVAPQRPGNDKAYVLNCDKIKALGWSPRVTVQQSIRETVDWVLNNYDELKDMPLQYSHKP